MPEGDQTAPKADPGGVDLTPIYRAAAKASLIQGGLGIVAGVVVSLLGAAIVGIAIIVIGSIRVLRGLIELAKWS